MKPTSNEDVTDSAKRAQMIAAIRETRHLFDCMREANRPHANVVTPYVPRPLSRHHLLALPNERQQVGVDGTGLRRGHPVRKALVCFQRAVLQQLCR